MAESITPYQLLASIASRSLQVAAGLPAQEEVQSYWSGIAFTLAGSNYVAPMDEVYEILSVQGFTRLPGVKPWMFGVSNVRGRLVPIIDMAMFLGERSQQSYRNKRILIIENEEFLYGLVVDSVEGMQHFPMDSYSEQSPPEVSAQILPFVQGHYTRDNRVWAVFSMHELVTSSEFMQVAS